MINNIEFTVNVIRVDSSHNKRTVPVQIDKIWDFKQEVAMKRITIWKPYSPF